MEELSPARFTSNIHELEDVILSGAPAKNFRPAAFAGRAGAESKDPYRDRIAKCSRMAQQEIGDYLQS
ncbi:MAG TPA: hypothetical protein VKG65_03260 [Terriglobales bacterium]|nr:hypothetical protein [Terriglobales bacterium]